MYSSIATYETLNELKKQDLIDFRLIYKRLSPEHNCVENTRKFVAIVFKSNFLKQIYTFIYFKNIFILFYYENNFINNFFNFIIFNYCL